MNTSSNNIKSPMFRHPIVLGCSEQLKSSPSAAEFVAELTLLSHHQPQLDRIELAVLESCDWKPSVPDPVIGKLPIPSVYDAFKDWADEIDRWHLNVNDDAEYLSFDQVRTQTWCRHKTQRELVTFLDGVDFPPPYLESERITQKAYQKALDVQADRRREAQKLRMQEARGSEAVDPSEKSGGEKVVREKAAI